LGNEIDELLSVDNLIDEETLWILADHLNSTRKILRNENNQITTVASIDYDAFGNIVTGVNPINIAYTGKYFDVITNLQWNINRWYDPNTGQWLSEDPIGFDGGDVNLYRYVGNDVINRSDSTGLSKASVVKIVYKQGEKVIKSIQLSWDEAIQLLRNKTTGNQNKGVPKNDKVKVFANPGGKEEAKSLSDEISPIGKSVHDDPKGGYPAHYHPLRTKKNHRGTPHITYGVSGVGLESLREIFPVGAEITFELSPLGDIKTIITDGSQIITASVETVQILVELGNPANVLNEAIRVGHQNRVKQEQAWINLETADQESMRPCTNKIELPFWLKWFLP
jgi:RHS repeat-associated protein